MYSLLVIIFFNADCCDHAVLKKNECRVKNSLSKSQDTPMSSLSMQNLRNFGFFVPDSWISEQKENEEENLWHAMPYVLQWSFSIEI